MTTTKVVIIADGCSALETFDYRSQYSLEDFAIWVSQRLRISFGEHHFGEEAQPCDFEWEGSIFTIRWSDERGSHIIAAPGLDHQLRSMQKMLADQPSDTTNR